MIKELCVILFSKPCINKVDQQWWVTNSMTIFQLMLKVHGIIIAEPTSLTNRTIIIKTAPVCSVYHWLLWTLSVAIIITTFPDQPFACTILTLVYEYEAIMLTHIHYLLPKVCEDTNNVIHFPRFARSYIIFSFNCLVLHMLSMYHMVQHLLCICHLSCITQYTIILYTYSTFHK